MDINFIADPNLIPKPRGEVRIEEIRAEPLEGGRRIRIELRITPFAPADRPNVTIQVIRPNGTDAGEISVIETMHNQIAMTFHLRDETPMPGVYHIQASLHYDDNTPQGAAEADVSLPADSV